MSNSCLFIRGSIKSRRFQEIIDAFKGFVAIGKPKSIHINFQHEKKNKRSYNWWFSIVSKIDFTSHYCSW